MWLHIERQSTPAPRCCRQNGPRETHKYPGLRRTAPSVRTVELRITGFIRVRNPDHDRRPERLLQARHAFCVHIGLQQPLI
eukprot:scaffold7012_cov157-Amphora_coffeaeformis.AAC.9